MKVFTIDFSPESKATSCSIYSCDHTQLRIHRLFYLNLLKTNTLICDFEISLKGLDHQQLLILYTATYFTSSWIQIFFPVDAC